jgi:acetoin utilization protein AcuC
MGGKAAFVFSDDFSRYDFAPGHPLSPKRLTATLDLLNKLRLLSPIDLLVPQPATRDQLLLVHDARYVDLVERLGNKPTLEGKDYSLHDTIEFGLGTEDNPIFPGMHQACSLLVGATITAAVAVMEGQVVHAVNLGGGLHHAHRSQASGFCLYNDAAVAIACLQQQYEARVVYIDTDAHHGDGVQRIFYDNPNVLTISLHETGRYLFPGTGAIWEMGQKEGLGYALNVPLEAFTEDNSWLEAYRQVVIPAVRQFKPDIIFTQNGCDGHRWDPLTHLAATTQLYREIPRLAHDLAHEVCAGRWVAVGGGGYDIYRVVPRAWTLLWAVASHQGTPANIPISWLEHWQTEVPDELPKKLIDPLEHFPPMPRRREIEEKNAQTVTALLDRIPWLKK